jgi:hypothetical protein
MRRFLIAFTLATIAAAATGVVTAAPAAAATVDVDEWAEGFCNALDKWQTSASKVRDLVRGAVDEGVTSAAAAKALRTKIVKGFGAASSTAAAASDDIEELGDPDLAGGARIRATVVSAIAATGTAFARAKAAAARASTEPERFQRAMRAIYLQVDGDLEKAGQRIEAIGALSSGDELDTAIENEQACDILTGT